MLTREDNERILMYLEKLKEENPESRELKHLVISMRDELEYSVIIRLHRDDLKDYLNEDNMDAITSEQMDEIAGIMGNYFCSTNFWKYLEEEYGRKTKSK